MSQERQATGPLLTVQNLSTTFRTPRGPVTAVDDVSFSLQVGETLGIVGESGSGKSVLVRSIMGLLPPSVASTTGKVVYGGTDLRDPTLAPRRVWGSEIAMVFQDPMTALNPTKRVGAHITESLRFHLRLRPKEAWSRAVEMLEQVGIPDPARRARQYPHELSGGMRQRVTIAVALACGPRLLIADEPTTALDVTVQKQILDLLGDLQREQNMAMILITHDLGVVAGRADKVGVMYAGRLIESAPTKPLFDQMRHPYTEGLLNSIPRMEHPSHSRLDALPGRPPNLAALPQGCRFAPRCRYVTDVCLEQDPPLRETDPGHAVACHNPLGLEPFAVGPDGNALAGPVATGEESH